MIPNDFLIYVTNYQMAIQEINTRVCEVYLFFLNYNKYKPSSKTINLVFPDSNSILLKNFLKRCAWDRILGFMIISYTNEHTIMITLLVIIIYLLFLSHTYSVSLEITCKIIMIMISIIIIIIPTGCLLCSQTRILSTPLLPIYGRYRNFSFGIAVTNNEIEYDAKT